MDNHTGMTLEEFIDKKIEDYETDKGQCSYHDDMFERGWVPMMVVNYYPALGRIKTSTSLTRNINMVLQNAGRYIFEQAGPSLMFEQAEPALTDIMGIIPDEVEFFITYFGTNRLMLDRQAYDKEGNLQKQAIQWYLSTEAVLPPAGAGRGG